MSRLPQWVHELLSDGILLRYQVFMRPKGRPPKKTLTLPLPLLCAVDAGQTTGVALLSPSWAVLLEARDDDFCFAKHLFQHFPKQETLCIESGFCPSAEAVYRAGVYAGFAYANDITPILIHPNAKPLVFKQSPLSLKAQVITHTLRAFRLFQTFSEGYGVPEHASDALGVALAYLRKEYNTPLPDFQFNLA